MRGEFIPLWGLPFTKADAERELSYNGPLPGPLPEPPCAIENGTNWVETALNPNQEANLLAMTLPPMPESPGPGLPTAFPELTSPPEAFFTEVTFVNRQPCPPDRFNQP